MTQQKTVSRSGSVTTGAVLIALAAGLVGGRATATAPSAAAPSPGTCTPNEVTICVAPGALPGWAFVTPSASPTTPPSPSVPPPSPTPGATLPTQVNCSTPIVTLINAAAPGSTINLGSCSYSAGISVDKSIRLYGGTFNQGGTALTINAADVTIESAVFVGGNNTIRISGDRTKILTSTFTGMKETSIRLQSGGTDDVLVQGNTIVQPAGTTTPFSPIACNDNVGKSNRLIIRGNSIDNGPGVSGQGGPYGLECWGNLGLVIEDNLLKGVGALISIPRSDGATIQRNTFGTQATGDAGFYWGAELADIRDVKVLDNIVYGDGTTLGPDGRAFLQLHPGGGTVERIDVERNKVYSMWAVLNAAGSGHTIKDNCLNGVTKLYAYSFSGAVTISNNGPC